MASRNWISTAGSFSPLRHRILPLVATATGVSVRAKIMGIWLGFALALGLGMTLEIHQLLSGALGGSLEKRAISITRDLSARSSDLILTNNMFALYEMARDTLENNDDVRYVFITDASGNILVHTFGNSFPQRLVQANRVGPQDRFSLKTLDSEEGLIYDVAVPVFEGKAGTARVGLSLERLEQTIDSTIRQLLIVIAVISIFGLAGAYALTLLLTRPVRELVHVAQAVGRGNLNQKARIYSRDDIGQLGDAFNVMIDDLAKSRDEIDGFNEQMLRRNRELSVLNAVAAAISRSVGLADVMEAALYEVLETMNIRAAWIVLVDENARPANVSYVGVSDEFAAGESHEQLRQCPCAGVLATGKIQLVRDIQKECPRPDKDVLFREGLLFHACIPLVSKGKVLGVMNVSANELQDLESEEMGLLSSIGNQIGIAVENATLWEELKAKEEIRAKLLQEVISAQEGERKRIARELHDETSQSLTSLIVGLKVLGGAQNLQEVEERAAELRTRTVLALEAVHDLALELRPSALDDLGLVPALQRYAKDFSRKHNVEVDFQATGVGEVRLGPEVETAIYRIVQEALTNIARHAHATSVSVLLENSGYAVIAIIEDDGKGFDVSSVLSSNARDRKLGLFGMQERASLIGAKLTIESQQGTGTSVFVEIPLGANFMASRMGTYR